MNVIAVDDVSDPATLSEGGVEKGGKDGCALQLSEQEEIHRHRRSLQENAGFGLDGFISQLSSNHIIVIIASLSISIRTLMRLSINQVL